MADSEGIGYEPSAWGKEYHALTCWEALGAGSAGPGKSLVLLHEADSQIVVEHQRCADPKHPHPLGWGQSTGWALHLRRELPRLEETIARAERFFPQLDKGAKFSAQNRIWTFSSGYRYQFGHCKERNDWESYLSKSFTIILFDELVEFDKEQYDQIKTRCRSSDPVLKNMLKVRSMSNPMMRQEQNVSINVRDPHWVRKYFVDPAPEGRKILQSRHKRMNGQEFTRQRIYLPATLYDNPDPHFVQLYEENLASAPEHIRQSLLYGNWYFTADGYYSAVWNKNTHVVRPFRAPPRWPMFRAMDWGFRDQGVVLWATVDPDDTMYIIYEFNFREKTAGEVADEIVRIERDKLDLFDGKGSQLIGPADTQLWEKRGESAKSKAEEMAARGVFWTKASKNGKQWGRAANALRIYSRLRNSPSTGAPTLFFFESCKMTIATLPGMQVDPNNSETPADGGQDHWHDVVCYMVAYASRGPGALGRVSKAEKKERWSDDRKRRGRYGYGSEIA